MEDKTWSSYIQMTEELYGSRALRFSAATKELWLSAIGAEDGDFVLEVGCAGGAMLHRLKEFLPSVKLFGIDFDTEHINFARKKTAELALEAEFTVGDATKMPYEDNFFDVCFSHTVVEHIPHKPFLSEQYRTLKPCGRISVLSAQLSLSVKDTTRNRMGDEEEYLMQKAWDTAERELFEAENRVGQYPLDVHTFPREMEAVGFCDINVDAFTFAEYAPDNSSTDRELALRQINQGRLDMLCSMKKALKLTPNSLTAEEKSRLEYLINERYDERVRKYLAGERVYDFATSTVIAVSGVKPKVAKIGGK